MDADAEMAKLSQRDAGTESPRFARRKFRLLECRRHAFRHC